MSAPLFLSTYRNAVDSKGRVSVPAPFRAALAGQTFQGIVAFGSVSVPAIEAFGMDRMERLSQHMDQHFDVFSQDQDDWASIFADAQPLAFDSTGRITLVDTLRQHGQLTDSVLFVGRGPTFQLWNPTLFQEYQAQARQRLQEKRKQGFGPLSPVAPAKITGIDAQVPLS